MSVKSAIELAQRELSVIYHRYEVELMIPLYSNFLFIAKHEDGSNFFLSFDKFRSVCNATILLCFITPVGKVMH
jgi:hypothetical protein